MSKHAAATLILDRKPAPPKHVVENLTARWYADDFNEGLHSNTPYTPGKHAKPFGKHHPAQPVTEATTANVIPLRKQATQAPTGCQICDDLDVAA